MNCYFTMTKDQTEFADHTAWAWLSARINAGQDHIGHREGDDKLWSYVRGVRLECAFYLWLGGREAATWNHKTIRHRKVSGFDILYRGHKIDVKVRPEGWADDENIVRCDQVVAGHVYVLGSVANYPLCAFSGWIPGAAVKQCRIGGRSDIPGHIVTADHPELRDCMSLKDDRYKI